MATIGRDTTIAWLGHGTFHITTPGGKRFLIDPWVESNPACPDAWKQRVKQEGLDVILITHGHFDHISDLLSLATLTDAKIACIFDVTLWLTAQGVGEERLLGFNCGGTVDIAGVRATMTTAHHSSTLNDNGQIVSMGEAVGYVLRMENGFTIYHTGDTAVTYDMLIIGDLGDVSSILQRESPLAARIGVTGGQKMRAARLLADSSRLKLVDVIGTWLSEARNAARRLGVQLQTALSCPTTRTRT